MFQNPDKINANKSKIAFSEFISEVIMEEWFK